MDICTVSNKQISRTTMKMKSKSHPSSSSSLLLTKNNIQYLRLSTTSIVVSEEQQQQVSSTTCSSAASSTTILQSSPQSQEEQQRLVVSMSETLSKKTDHLKQARRLLYLSHFFHQFSGQAWQFCLILFLSSFAKTDESLILICSYGLVSGICVCLFGSTAGRFVDNTNRLVVARTFIGVENVSVLVATLFCYLLSTATTSSGGISTSSSSDYYYYSIFLLVGIHILGATAQIINSGFVVAIERDWVVVMSKVLVLFDNDGISMRRGDNDEDDGDDDSSKLEETEEEETEEEENALQVQLLLLLQQEKQNNWLSETNVAMKQIYLSCKIFAPALAGFFVALFDNNDDMDNQNRGSDDGNNNNNNKSDTNLQGAAVFLALLNVLALIVEIICTRKMYDNIPSLGIKQGVISSSTEPTTSTTTIQYPEQKEEHHPCSLTNSMSNTNGEDDDDNHNHSSEVTHYNGNGEVEEEKPRCAFGRLLVPSGLSIYFKQSISWAGISYALLYLNVLTFGGIMTGYLVWRGMRLEAIGIWRGVSSASGLAGTFVYRFLSSTKRRGIGLMNTGMYSVMFQFFCLSLSFASLFIDDFNTSTTMLIAGVCASRVGLWVFDISVTQLMQEHIPEEVRGLVGGVQESIGAFFGLLSFALGFMFPDPKDFHIYVSVGYTAVGLAFLCFSLGVLFTNKKRKQQQQQQQAVPTTNSPPPPRRGIELPQIPE